jgi:hypothetical protein
LKDFGEAMHLGSYADDAFAFVRTMGITKGLLQDLDEPAQERALDEVRATLAAHQGGEGVRFGSRAWLITARRA